MSRRSELFRRIAEIEKAKRSMEEPQYNAALVRRARERMTRVDTLPTDIRGCIHEYGLEIVQEFLNHGVRKAKSIAHLIETVRGSDFPNGGPRFKLNKGPGSKRNPAEKEDEYYSVVGSR